MTYILVDTPSDEKRIKWLLNKNVPSYRQAYSDRTAYLMACLSELAYLKFNPLFSIEEQKKYFLERIEKLVGDKNKSSLVKLIDLVGYDHVEEEKKLKCNLELLRMELIKPFDENGTQAILVRTQSFIVLAFRGTEADSIKDIKSDAKAKPVKDETKGGRIHMG